MFLGGVKVISFAWRDCSRDMVKDIRGLETLIYLGFEGVRVEGRVVVGGVKWEGIPKGKKGLR